MKLPILPVIAGVALAGCVHTPPGTSVEVALAKKAELYRLPKSAEVVSREKKKEAPSETPSNNKAELAAEAFTRGQFCMKAGKDEEAIAAFEEAVKLDPQFHDAWACLAMLYEKTGQEKKAIDAFRKSKKIARG
jgi:Tfp pilus assembly protein PilF